MEKDSLLSQWKAKKKTGISIHQIEKAPEGEPIPLSNGQQRLWFLQQLYPDNTFYNHSEFYNFEGELQILALKNSLNIIFNQNEILKSYYPLEDGKPVIKLVEEDHLDIIEYNFSNLSFEKALDAKKEVCDKQAQIRFNLANAPLIKASLIKVRPKEHTLFLTFHHIITDIWTLGLLRTQLASHYQNLISGNKVEVFDQDINYLDYAYWQTNTVNYDEQLKYWKKKLSGEVGVLNLPTDFQRPSVPTYKGKQHITTFSKELSSNVLKFTKNNGVTPYVFLLSVYNLLLFKYTRQNDILIGSPVSNRSQKKLENIFGFFIDTVVLRNSVNNSDTFIKFLDSVKEQTINAFANKDMPFDLLVKALNIERSLSINPFFQVMFVFDKVEELPKFGSELELVKNAEYGTGVAKFDLTLFISEEEGILTSKFEYSTDLFEEETIVQFQEHLKLLAREIILNPEIKIQELSILTEKEKTFFNNSNLNVGKKKLETSQGIHEIIENIATTYPQKIALSFNTLSMTYGDLNVRANYLASLILEKTNGNKEFIGLSIERSMDMIIGMLAILKSGCAYLPIDPEYPKERIDYIIDDAKINLILTQSSYSSLFDNRITQLHINTVKHSDTTNKINLPKVKNSDIAYIIYTSGSTGNPKGVPITHKNIINSTIGRQEYYQNNPEAFLLMSSISFDSSKAGIFWTLCSGGNLVITEKRIEQDISKIENLIKTHNISHTLMLPSLYKLIIEHTEPNNLQSLNAAIVAGEACGKDLCELHFKTLPHTLLYNEYGPTEGTVWCTAHKISPKDFKYDTIPIGKPVANAEIYILDENHKLVPFGAIGEIYIGGIGLSGIYLNKPDLTNLAYVKHPFTKDKTQRLYKTGDLGRFRNDGAIEFLGRVDYQVKIRGYRIELDEIKTAIIESKFVEDAVVVTENSKNPNQIPQKFEDAEELVEILEKNLSKEQINQLLNLVE